jgi:pimeloyl-ACP methyl ester carboxylesterase
MNTSLYVSSYVGALSSRKRIVVFHLWGFGPCKVRAIGELPSGLVQHEPVVLVHGWGGSFRRTWQEPGMTALLEDAGRQVIGVDLLGHGDAPSPTIRRRTPT